MTSSTTFYLGVGQGIFFSLIKILAVEASSPAAVPIILVSVCCLPLVTSKYYMHFQFPDSIACCSIWWMDVRFHWSLVLTPLFSCVLVFLLSSPTSSFSIYNKILEARNMALLLGDKDKGNEALGLGHGTVVLLYTPLLCWKFWTATWLPGYSISGTFSFPHFGTYNVFKCFFCRLFCHTWENNQTVYQYVDKEFITPWKSAFHFSSQHSSQVNVITFIYYGLGHKKSDNSYHLSRCC